MVKNVPSGEVLCEFQIPQINEFASGVLHPEVLAHLERARNHPKVGLLREYKKEKLTFYSVHFLATRKTVGERAHKYKTYTEAFVMYMTKLALAAEKFLMDFHKTQKISISYEEWVEKHISSDLREKLKVPLKRKPPVRTPKKDAEKGPDKKSTKKPIKKVGKKTKVIEDTAPATSMVETALLNIKAGKDKKN